MRNGYVFAVVVVFILTLALSCTALAAPGSVVYRKFYDLDGIILMKIQTGSDYSTTGQHKTLVTGEGELTRDELVKLSKGGIVVENDNIWVADPDSLRGLEVASTFHLNDNPGSGIPGSQQNSKQSEQVFAVSVDANRGEEGSLSQKISAGSAVYSDEDENFFSISQTASTSDGTVKRRIDLTEPVSGEYLFEDTVIKGRVHISEVLTSSESYADYIARAGASSEEANVANNDQPKEAVSESKGEQSEEKEAEVIANDEETADDEVAVIDGSEIFESTVPLGTTIEDLGLLDELSFNSELVTVNDIYVKWDDQLLATYNPDETGSYSFEGKLIFPDTLLLEDEVYIYHVVNVVDQAQYENYRAEKQQSDHLEDLVHGGEDGEDEQADKEADR